PELTLLRSQISNPGMPKLTFWIPNPTASDIKSQIPPGSRILPSHFSPHQQLSPEPAAPAIAAPAALVRIAPTVIPAAAIIAAAPVIAPSPPSGVPGAAVTRPGVTIIAKPPLIPAIIAPAAAVIAPAATAAPPRVAVTIPAHVIATVILTLITSP